MKTVLITGAASGLGWALARQFHRQGDCVILVDRDAALLQKRADTLGEPDDNRVYPCPLDVTDSEALDTLADWLKNRPDELNVLVNNAGITHRSLAARTDPEVFRRVMAVDWQAPVELTLKSLPLLRASGGTIINIGSMAGWMPVLGRAGYCSAKGALTQFFETLRGEVAADGVHILMAYPSFLDTPIDTNALGFDGRPACHKRSRAGGMRTPDWMAKRIVRAANRGHKRLYGDGLSRFGSILWRIWPDLYQRLMTKRFASELAQ